MYVGELWSMPNEQRNEAIQFYLLEENKDDEKWIVLFVIMGSWTSNRIDCLKPEVLLFKLIEKQCISAIITFCWNCCQINYVNEKLLQM